MSGHCGGCGGQGGQCFCQEMAEQKEKEQKYRMLAQAADWLENATVLMRRADQNNVADNVVPLIRELREELTDRRMSDTLDEPEESGCRCGDDHGKDGY